MNTALALGTEEILLGTFLMSRNELECKIDSEKAVHDLLMAFLLAIGVVARSGRTRADAPLFSCYGYLAQPRDQWLSVRFNPLTITLIISYHSHYQSTLVFYKDPLISTSVSPR